MDMHYVYSVANEVKGVVIGSYDKNDEYLSEEEPGGIAAYPTSLSELCYVVMQLLRAEEVKKKTY